MKINRAMELHHGARNDAAQALFQQKTFKEFLIFIDSAHWLNRKSATRMVRQERIVTVPEERSVMLGPQAPPAQLCPELQEYALPDSSRVAWAIAAKARSAECLAYQEFVYQELWSGSEWMLDAVRPGQAASAPGLSQKTLCRELLSFAKECLLRRAERTNRQDPNRRRPSRVRRPPSAATAQRRSARWPQKDE
jgi:hypothetical protein